MRAVELERDAAVPVAGLLLAFARRLEPYNAAGGKCWSAHVDDEGFAAAAAGGHCGGLDHQAAELGFHRCLRSLVGAECRGDFVVAVGSVEGEEEWCAADARRF